MSLTVSPTGDLGDAFAVGWNKLSDEIKLRILSCNLLSDDPLHSKRLHDARDNLGRSYTIRPEFDKHLAMGADIARLAHDVFYRGNHFALFVRNGTVFLPPSASRSLIREITILASPTEEDWFVLEQFSKRANGFVNIWSIVVALSWPGHYSLDEYLHPPQHAIHFACNGVLRVLNNSLYVQPHQLRSHVERRERLEASIRSWITFTN
ncbi:hypothetical protein CC86DRAFT_371199 [Ophiobolus disseminans]|uniref:Uncharacterized protein n=1 Tax=Ophiobolus disseminans TaxID=1469910 RepID=A0A6A6ZUA0_9PLEO|nr:hypothetical protein CC86DRAFT_371199 [Ophiobolus disseminans]